MPAIVSCPRCQKAVSVPAGVESAAPVRCPLCDAEYPLSEALPPELIPVAAAAASESAWAADIVVDSAAAVEGRAVVEKGEDAKKAAVAAPVLMAPVRLRRRAPKSPLRTLIEVLSGGLAGCLVAYYGLALWLGPQFKTLGFPELPLTSWVTTLRGAGDTPAEKPAADPAVKPKPEKAV
jgi:hypothetical protein